MIPIVRFSEPVNVLNVFLIGYQTFCDYKVVISQNTRIDVIVDMLIAY